MYLYVHTFIPAKHPSSFDTVGRSDGGSTQNALAYLNEDAFENEASGFVAIVPGKTKKTRTKTKRNNGVLTSSS